MAVPVFSAPRVSALVCTRNRGASLERTLRSILHPQSICSELIVIDQSSDRRTRDAVQPFLSDPRLNYVRSKTEGKGAALNLGIEMAAGEFVAITDDDCEPAVNWPRCHVEALTNYPKVAISYGNVVAGSHDAATGFIPDYRISRDRLCRSILEKLPARGIGANTAVRRADILALGGFDTEVGPGGAFRAGIDRDMTVRCILAGYHVYESCQSVVIHHGFRDWDAGRELAYNAWYGMGASYLKPLRCGRWDALPVGIYEFAVFAVFPFLGNAIRGRKRAGWLRIRGFMDGLRAGWKQPVDKENMRYLPGSQAVPNDYSAKNKAA